jgi:TolB-like protein/Tfp pilus assembly protein PilF
MQTETALQVFTIGGFTLDLRKGILHRGNVPVPLRPKAHALLTHLAQNMGRIVPKTELMDAVWSGIYVTEDSLTQSIREIRKALGDENQELVRSISRRGYMLTALTTAEISPGLQPIVAVLRFRNETGDPDQVPLVDGFAEDIINGLARFGTVTVLARNSSFSLASETRSDWSLARSRIGANYLVEGSIRRYDSRLRATVNLVDAASLAHLWSERYDVEGTEVFSILEDIIERIVSRLVNRLDDAEVKKSAQKPASSLASYELTLRGMALLRRNDPEDIATARKLFELAIEKDPSYGLAHAQLAFSKVMMSGYGWAPPEMLVEARDMATKAIMLSRDQPAGHRVLSFIQMYLGDYASAEHNLKRAIELNPCDAESVDQMGYLLTLRGRPSEALLWFDRAVKLDPLHPPWYSHDRSLALYSLGDYLDAAKAIEPSSALSPWIRIRLAACYAQHGDIATARAHAAMINILDPTFSPVNYAKGGVAFEHETDLRHFAEGVYLALGLPQET